MNERLEEINQEYKWNIENELLPRLSDDKIEFLIRKAKKVQRLEARETDLIKINQHEMKYRANVARQNFELDEENKKLAAQVKQMVQMYCEASRDCIKEVERNIELQMENKRYQEALKEILKSHDISAWGYREIARKGLEGEE